MLRKEIGLFLAFLITQSVSAQDDLLSEIDQDDSDHRTTSVFKSLKIINLESTKLAARKDFFLVISHRFGFINSGFDNFFGLDNANTRIHMIYGLSDDFNVHVSRSGFNKTYEAGVKYKFISQKEQGIPLSMVYFGSMSINTAWDKELLPELNFSHRLAYVSQLLVSRKFSNYLSLELAPSYLHENLVLEDNQTNSQFALGVGGRLKLTSRTSLNLDYLYHVNRTNSSGFRNPLSIGVDIETGGHVFQLHFTNSYAMHESGFIGQTTGDWQKAEISFGFNLIRVF